MTRAATWANSDNLVVGYGKNFAEREADGVMKTDGIKTTAVVDFTYQSTVANVTVDVPAQAVIDDVYLVVGTQWAGGTDVQIGDAGDADGFISAAQGATANLTTGKIIRAGGAYVVADTDTTAQELKKVYTSATPITVAFTGTFTAGSARLVVEYSLARAPLA